MALTDSLISYWKLDEASGNALDAHGANELTETSGIIDSATGKVGNARDFEFIDTEYFTHADNADLSTGDIDFTIACWIKPETLTGFPVVASKGDSNPATSNTEWLIWYNSSTSRLTFSVCKTTTYTDRPADTFGALSNGTWYFVVVWHDSVNNQIGIAINAGTADTTSYSSGVNDGNRDFVIGASILQSLYWDGLIDEFGFWKRVLTSDERTSLYNAGSGLAYPLTVAGGIVPVLMRQYRARAA